ELTYLFREPFQARRSEAPKNHDRTASATDYPDSAEVCYLTHKTLNRNQQGETDRNAPPKTQEYCTLQPPLSQVGSQLLLENESYRTLFVPRSFTYSDQCIENCIAKAAPISSGARTVLSRNKLFISEPTDQNDFDLARDITFQSQRTPIPIFKPEHNTFGLSNNIEKSTKGIKHTQGKLLNVCPANEGYDAICVNGDREHEFIERNITFLSDNEFKTKDSNTNSASIPKNKTKVLANRTMLNNKQMLNDPVLYTVENVVNIKKCSADHLIKRQQERNYSVNPLDPVKDGLPHPQKHTTFV
ncbi:hypothetical protein P879_09133, partial [Paragonimus westermani]